MSLVTGVLVYVSSLSVGSDSSPQLHTYLTGPVRPDGTGDGAQHLNRLDEDQAGGYKWIGGSVYAGGFNYVSTDDVRAFLKRAPWGDYGAVAIIDYEHDDRPDVSRWPA